MGKGGAKGGKGTTDLGFFGSGTVATSSVQKKSGAVIGAEA